MEIHRRHFITGLAFSVVVPTAHGAEAWPDHAIRLVVSSSAGGGADAASRVFAQSMSEILGQPVVVDNRPGASGMIASTLVAREKPDGYSVLYDTFAAVINAVSNKLSYDFEKDLRPVSQAINAPAVMLVQAQSPYKSVKDFVVSAKARKGKITFASGGPGGVAHLSGELLQALEDIQLVHVPYKGGAPAVTGLLGGHVDSYFASISSALPHIKSGKLRPLAVTANKRLPALGDVPTFVELGHPEFVISEWNGFFVPGKTPEDVVQRLSRSIQEATRSKALVDRLEALGMNAVGSTPDEFRAFLAAQMKQWAALIKAHRIALE